MKYAIIDGNNQITTILRANYTPDTESGYVEIPEDAEPMDYWDGVSLTKWVEPLPEPRTRLSRLEFRNKFTTAEKAALYTAAETDVFVKILLDDVAAAEYIELTDQSTIEAVGYLGTSGVIDPTRVDEVLAGIPQ